MMWGWNYYDGWGWFGITVMILLFSVLAIWAIRAFSSPRQDSDSAIATLRQRLAAGQISQDEFEKSKKVLQG
jgi:uncharacterized membrane protein